jgi:hypothetical protein
MRTRQLFTIALITGSTFAAAYTDLARAEEAPDEGAEEKPDDSKKGEAVPDSGGVFVEPLLAIFGFYEGDVNISVDDNLALSVWGQYFDYTLFDTGVTGFGIGLGVPIFLTGSNYRGMYLHPLLKYQQVDFDVSDAPAVSASFYGPQVTVGYQWTWSHFSLKVGGGLEYSFGEVSSDSVDESVALNGFGVELDAALGVVF